MRNANLFSPNISDDIVHIDIDDASLREVGRWPWDRDILAMAIDVISEAGAHTIVLDLLLDDPQTVRYDKDWAGRYVEVHDDQSLAAEVADAGDVLVGVNIETEAPIQEESPDDDEAAEHRASLAEAESKLIVRWPIDEVRPAVAGVGFVNVGEANTSSVRSLRAAVDVDGSRLYQLGVAATGHFLDAWPNGVSATKDKLRVGDIEVPLHDWRALIPWRPREGESGTNSWSRIHTRIPMHNFVKIGRAERFLRLIIGTIIQNAPLDRPVTAQDMADADEAAAFMIESFDGKPIEDVISTMESQQPLTVEAAEELRYIYAVQLLPEMHTIFDDIEHRLNDPKDGLRPRLDGKLVFVGWTGTGALADFYPTALDLRTPGVCVHSAIANGILTRQWIKWAPAWLDLLITIVAGLSATLVASWLSPSRGWIAAVLLTGAYVAFNVIYVFDFADTVLALGAPVVAAIGAWATCTTIRAIQERREKAAIRRQFRARVSAQLVDYLTEHPDLVNMEGEERELTIAFTDFVGFTSISEKLEGRATVAMLNRYLRAMTDVMLDRTGYVNKFLGDGIMAFWGAPAFDNGHAASACFSALECYDALDMLNKAPEYADLPKLGMRIGISTGKVIVGDCGAPPRLNDYTVIGDAVNLAARLESANKMLGTRALVTGRTLEFMSEEERARILWRPIGRIRVVGQTKTTEVFELVARTDDPEVTDEIRQWVQDSTDAVDLFSRGEIAAAQEKFQDLILFERGSAGALLYMERCAELLESKREDFFLPLRSK